MLETREHARDTRYMLETLGVRTCSSRTCASHKNMLETQEQARDRHLGRMCRVSVNSEITVEFLFSEDSFDHLDEIYKQKTMTYVMMLWIDNLQFCSVSTWHTVTEMLRHLNNQWILKIKLVNFFWKRRNNDVFHYNFSHFIRLVNPRINVNGWHLETGHNWTELLKTKTCQVKWRSQMLSFDI